MDTDFAGTQNLAKFLIMFGRANSDELSIEAVRAVQRIVRGLVDTLDKDGVLKVGSVVTEGAQEAGIKIAWCIRVFLEQVYGDTVVVEATDASVHRNWQYCGVVLLPHVDHADPSRPVFEDAAAHAERSQVIEGGPIRSFGLFILGDTGGLRSFGLFILGKTGAL